MRNRNHVMRAVARWTAITGLLAGVMFLAAGTTHIRMVRTYLAVFSSLLLLTMLAVDPGLAQERVHPGGGAQDATGRFAISFLFLTTLGFAAVDVGRLHESNTVPGPLSVVSLVAFAAALSLQIWAMIVNPFFSPVIRIQAERGHHVITEGPYRFLRHPGYVGMLFAIPASAIAIGSWLALIPAAGFDLIIVRRARAEDELLKGQLPGYIEYMQSVPGGLLPRFTTRKGLRNELPGASGYH